jgi:NADPH:quinone reductase
VKAILCTHHGTADDLVLADIPDPVPGPGEVVAKVAAVGLNFFDTLIIAGKYQTKPSFPFSPGGELAGVVESVGPGVNALRPGDRVMGYSNFNAASAPRR